MFDNFTASILNRFVGDFLNISHLDLSIWQGDILLEDVEIRPTALHKLKLPYRVVAGNVGKLKVKLPWQHLNSKPVEVIANDLRLFAVPDGAVPYNAEFDQQERLAVKMAVLQRFEGWSKAGSSGSDSVLLSAAELKDLSYSEQLIASIRRNLRVHVETIHIRYEEEGKRTDKSQSFNLGMLITSVQFESTDKNWVPTFLQEGEQTVHKVVVVHEWALYANFGPRLYNSAYARNLSDEDKLQILKEMSRLAQTLDDEFKIGQFNYVIDPISFPIHLKLTRNPGRCEPPFSVPEMVAEIAVRKLVIGISHSEFYTFVRLTHSMEPAEPPVRCRNLRPTVGQYKNYRLWWKYAFECVKQGNHFSWSHIKNYRQMFKLYTELQLQLLSSEDIGAANEENLKTYEQELDLLNLVIARRGAQLEFEREQRLESVPGTRWFDSMVETGAREVVERRVHEPWTVEEKKTITDAVAFCNHGAVPHRAGVGRPIGYAHRRINFFMTEFEMFVKEVHQEESRELKLCIDKFDFGIDLHPRPQTGFKFEWKLKSLHVVKLAPTPDKANDDGEIPVPVPHFLLRTTTPGPDSPLHPQNAVELTFQKMPSDSPTAGKARLTISSLEVINHSRIWKNIHRLATEKKVTLKTKVPTDPVGRMRFRAISCVNFLIVYPYLILHAMAEE